MLPLAVGKEIISGITVALLMIPEAFLSLLLIAIMIYIAGQTALAGNVKGLFTTKIDRNWFITIITVLVNYPHS